MLIVNSDVVAVHRLGFSAQSESVGEGIIRILASKCIRLRCMVCAGVHIYFMCVYVLLLCTL